MAQTEEQKRLWTETLKAALAATEQAKQAGTNPQVAARKAAAAVISAATPQKTDWVQETAKQLAPATGKDKYKATTTDDNLVDTTKAMARDQQNSPKAKAYEAEKEHQDYLKSDEYKQSIAEQEKKVNQDRIMQGILTGNADIATPSVVQDDKELRLRNAAQQARAAVDAEADAKVMSADLTDILSMTPEERRQLELYAVGRDVDYFNTLNFTQNGIQVGTAEKNAADLIAKYGQKRVDELAESYSRAQNARTTEAVAAAGQKHGNEHAFLGSAASVGANALGGLMGTMDYAKNLGRYDNRYKTLDPNAMGNLGSAYAGAVRGQVQQKIEGEDPGFWRKVGSIAYQGVMSTADSIARAYLGGGALGGATLAATNSFSQTMADASKAGATPAQAALLATTTAGIEALSEKIPLDNLIKTAGAGKQNALQIVKTALMQAGIEATTEEISLIGTVLAEAAILGEKSDYQQKIAAEMANGMTQEQAAIVASKDLWDEAVNTALVSMVSGGMSSVSGSVKANIAEARAEKAAKATKDIKQETLDKVRSMNQQEQAETAATEQPKTQERADFVAATADEAAQKAPAQPQETPKTEAQQNVDAAAAEVFAKNAEEQNRLKQAQEQTAKQEEVGLVADKGMPSSADVAKNETTEKKQSEQLLTEVQQPNPVDTSKQETPTEQQKTDEVENSSEIKGTGAAEANFTGNAAYENLLSDENVQRERKGDVRSEEVPVKDAEGRKVSEAAGNIMNSGWTPDSVTGTIKKMIQEGKASHDVLSNETSLKNAAAAIEKEGGVYSSLQTIKEQASKGWTSPEAVAKAELIYHHFANEVAKMEENGGADETTKSMTADAFVTLAQLATNSGQSTQLFSVFRRMTPELQIKTVEKNVKRYIDDVNKSRTGKKKVTATAESKAAQKPVEDAVKTARKDAGKNAQKAAGKVRFKGDKVTVDDKYNEPFVFEYAQKVGEALAKGLENKRKPKPQKTFLQAMTSEIKKFAAEKMPPAKREKTWTATELLKDYIENQDFYAEAWGAAQQTLRDKYGNDPYFQGFVNSGIGVDANNNPQNKIMAKALAAAAIEAGETTEILRKQEALGITGMSDNIANVLIRETGATGEMAQTIRDAAYEFVKNKIAEGDSKENAKNYSAGSFVDEAMRDIKKSMADVAKKNAQGRAAAKQAVVDALTQKYGIGVADADHIAEVVGDTFDQKAQDKARQILEQKFGERDKKTPKSAGELIEEYANLGAYASESQYSEKATESFLNAAMRDIGKTLSDLAKSGKADREAVKAQISEMITKRHGIDRADADHIAEVVGDQLEVMTQERAKQILEQKFKDRPQSVKKTAMQMLTEYANLGAFEAGFDYNEKATAKIVGDQFGATLREDLVQDFLKAKTEDEKAKALDEIYKDVASQIEPTLEDAWDAWRNMAMLLNPKTHARNFLSTGAFKPYPVIKRNIGAVIESCFVDKRNRTKAILGIDKKSRDLVTWAKADARTNQTKEAFESYGFSGNEAAREIQKYRKMLPGFLDKLSKWNIGAMEAEDMLWKRSEYAATLASFLKAKGYTAEQAAKGQIPSSVLSEGRQLAITEAAKATFNDRNRFSDAVSKFRVKGDDPVSKTVNALAKGVLPFAKTPANVVVRVKEYSPIEIARGFHTLAAKVKTGEATVSQGIDQIASGLTGTGMMILGAALADGLIPGVKLVGRVEDEEEEVDGVQDYSVKIGDQYYGIGFLAPACIPLMIGAELNKAFPSWEDFAESSAFEKADALASIGSATLDPMLELSMLSSLNGIVNAYTSAETPGEGATAALITAATSYFTQGLPTVVGQLEQAAETRKTSAYVNTDNPTEKTIKYIASNASQRVPGVDLYRTEKLDEWGRPVEVDGDQATRLVNAMFNPFTVTKVKTDELAKEMTRLNNAQENSVTPPTVDKVVSYTDRQGTLHKNYRLTAEEYQTIAKTQGQTARNILERMTKSANYKALTDDQKAKAWDMVYSYSKEKAKVETLKTAYSEDWMMSLKPGSEADTILRRITDNAFTSAISKVTAAWANNYSPQNTRAYAKQLDTAYQSYSKMSAFQKEAVKETATGLAADYIEARENGISNDVFLETLKDIKKLQPEPEQESVRAIQKAEAVAGKRGLSEDQKEVLVKQQLSDAQDKNLDDLQDMGYDVETFVQLYRDYEDFTSGTGKKNRTIQKWMKDYGLSNSAAKAIYEVFQK